MNSIIAFSLFLIGVLASAAHGASMTKPRHGTHWNRIGKRNFIQDYNINQHFLNILKSNENNKHLVYLNSGEEKQNLPLSASLNTNNNNNNNKKLEWLLGKKFNLILFFYLVPVLKIKKRFRFDFKKMFLILFMKKK
jgi:hypothetical protein